MHISLDAALQRQPLLSTVGDKLLPTFPGAAAAYSLRALNGDANDVVNVRRSGDDEERDFTAEGVSFELEDWVNGKLETTLPCDHITTIEVSGINTGSDGADGTYTLTAPLRWDGPNGHVIIRNTGDSLDPYEANTRWLLVDADDLFVAIFSDPCDESVLPFDATWSTGTFTNPNAAAAAYSLRKVRNDYAGDAVQIRRASDNVEVNVAFDSNGEVSTSSAITNVVESPDRGDTTATTLGEFLTEDVSAYYDAEDGTTTGWVKADFDGSSTTISNVTSGAISGSRSIQIDITSGSATNAGYPRVRKSTSGDLNLSAGLQYNIKCKLKLTAGVAKVYARLGSASGNIAFSSQTLVVGEVLEIDETFTPSSIRGVVNNIEFVFNGTLGTGTILIDDLELTALNHNATVVTWYDQSGNGNDATQLTTGDQPKIAEGGSLLANGINFESGVNLPLSGSGLDIFKDVGYGQIFSVIKPRETGTGFARYFEATIGTGSGARFLFGDGQDVAAAFRIGGRSLDGDSFGDEESPTSHNNELSLITGFLNYTDAEGFVFLNGTQGATNSIPNITAGNTSDTSSQNVAIGSYNASLTAEFNAKEFIIFNSDQTANRFKIESNINNYYGIYTPAEDGFVETWYDQSGNGEDAVQLNTELQPQIVSAGSYLGELDFDGVNDELETGSNITASTITGFVVANLDGTDANSLYAVGNSSPNVLFGNPSLSYVINGGTALSGGTAPTLEDALFTQLFISGGTSKSFINGSETASGDAGSNTASSDALSIGSLGAFRYMNASMKELILYSSDQSANRTAIESNIADEYGITLS